MRRLLLATLLVTTIAVQAEEPEDPTAKLLGTLEPKDARVQGRAWYSALSGGRNVGTLEVDVAATTSGTSSLHARAVVKIAIEDERAEIEEVGLLDRRLAPDLMEERERAAGQLLSTRKLVKKTGHFALTIHEPPAEPRTLPLAPARPVLEGLSSRHAFLRLIDARAKATYVACDVDTETNAVRELTIEVPGVPDTTWVPEAPRPLYPVHLKNGAAPAWSFLLDPAAPPALRVVRFMLTDRAGVEYVLARDAESATKDPPAPKRPPAGTGRLTILEYLEAVEGRDADKLAKLLDWPSLHRKYADPGQTVDSFRSAFLQQFKDAGDHDHDHGKEESPLSLVPRLIEEPFAKDALETTVRIRGEAGAFRLVRDQPGSPWRIAELPD